ADGITDETMLFFLGTAKPHALVTVLLDGVELGTATADEAGAWRYDHTGTTLADGTYQVTATQQDAAGNPPSPVSDPYRVIVDTNEGGTVPTEPPVITGFEEDSGVVGDGITNDNTIAFTGTSTETDGTVVTVTLLDEGGATVATLTATVANGTWTTGESPALPDGNYTATATQQDAAGNPPSGASEATSVTIDTNEGGTIVTPPPVIVAIADDNGRENDDGITNDDTIQVLGSSDEPDGAVVTVTIRDSANAVVATLTATVFEGRWSTEPTAALADGDYTISATQQDAAGNDPSGPSNLFDMVIDTNNGGANPTPAPVVTGIEDDTGFDPGDGITQDQTLFFFGTGEAGATVWLYIDGDEIGSNIVDENGEWFVDNTDNALGQGTYQITARQQDAAGNDISGYSDAYQVTVDTDAPSVSIRAMSNDYGEVGDFITHADETRLSGTTDPNIRIDVFVEGVNIGSMISDANGYWESELIDLSHLGVGDTLNVTVRARNAAGITATAEQVIARQAHELSMGTLNPESGFVIVGDKAGDTVGRTVDLIGDVNNDGFADALVGALDFEAGQHGTAFLIFGSAEKDWGALQDGRQVLDLSNLAPDEGVMLRGNIESYFGMDIHAGGDLNGDGIQDVIIGEQYQEGSSVERAYVVFGREGKEWGEEVGGRRIMDVYNLDSSDGFIMTLPLYSRTGYRVWGGGDVDGDGVDDIIIGSNGSGRQPGEAHVIFGEKDGEWGDMSGNSRILNLRNLPADKGLIINGYPNGVNFGSDVTMGDVNGDGLDDFLITGRDEPGNTTVTHIIFGNEERSWGNVSGGKQVLNIADLAPEKGVILVTDPHQYQYHPGVGDLNGDGIGDIVLKHYINTAPQSTHIDVIFGRSGTRWVPGTGQQRLMLDDVAEGEGFRIISEELALNSSELEVSDFNGDGHDDLLIGGARSAVPGKEGEFAYILFGRGDGNWGEVVDGKRVVDLSKMQPGEGVRLLSEASEEGFGYHLSAGGDINGDGLADILVGALLNDIGGTDAGAAYVIYGQANGFGSGFIRRGSAADDWMSGSEKNDQLNGMGGNDTLLGYEGDDILTVADAGFLKVDGGAGDDTLVISGGGVHLDLTALNQDAVKGIEMVDLSGSGANRMTVTEQDVLDMSDAGLVKLRGDIDDSATATGFTDSGTDQTENGVTYDVYTSGGATLWIDQQMSVTI
uniref:Ig-like domain-containing protein n=1 Tax=Nitratireductor sp. CH_MIT9313-5 TaxID=3107764 RepID=UPI00300A4103